MDHGFEGMVNAQRASIAGYGCTPPEAAKSATLAY